LHQPPEADVSIMSAPDRSENTPLYVIGDIHGRLDLLDRLIGAIDRDVGGRGAESLTVTVGDYIDRGPDSRGVVRRLMRNPFPGRYVALKGNHEAMMIRFLADPQVGSLWSLNGGLETLRSFGVPVSRDRPDFVRAAEALRAALTADETRFLSSLRLSLSVGRYFICHAGVRPGVPLERQSEEDLLWIRDEFLNSNVDFGKIIVHGHTPVPEPEVKPNRINVDTGAFATGRLTCVVLEGGAPRFLMASSNSDR
jgi:serine/threonine protein phosphatase 1